MKAIPEHERHRLIFLAEQLGSVRAAAKKCGRALSVAQRWVDRAKRTGGVAVASRKGRPRALSSTAARRAVELLLDSDHGSGAAAAQQLHTEGHTAAVVHRTTVTRAARSQASKDGAPIGVLRGRPAKQLTAATKQKRLAFAQRNRNRDWRSVMFTDRKKFLFLHPGAKVRPCQWVRQGQRREAAAVNRPMAFNVYMGVTVRGVTAVHAVAGTSGRQHQHTNKKGQPARDITAGEYREVLTSTLLPGGQARLGQWGLSAWVLQQDNDPTHRGAADIIEGYNRSHGTSISLLPNWPPHSPDLSPIENVWGMVQQRVNALGCQDFQSFQRAVIQELKGVSKAVLGRLYASMPKRLALVEQRGGDKCGY
jgi:molybdenum-dependent DNA-binding transcriptional regulator ModE